MSHVCHACRTYHAHHTKTCELCTSCHGGYGTHVTERLLLVQGKAKGGAGRDNIKAAPSSAAAARQTSRLQRGPAEHNRTRPRAPAAQQQSCSHVQKPQGRPSILVPKKPPSLIMQDPGELASIPRQKPQGLPPMFVQKPWAGLTIAELVNPLVGHPIQVPETDSSKQDAGLRKAFALARLAGWHTITPIKGKTSCRVKHCCHNVNSAIALQPAPSARCQA